MYQKLNTVFVIPHPEPHLWSPFRSLWCPVIASSAAGPPSCEIPSAGSAVSPTSKEEQRDVPTTLLPALLLLLSHPPLISLPPQMGFGVRGPPVEWYGEAGRAEHSFWAKRLFLA